MHFAVVLWHCAFIYVYDCVNGFALILVSYCMFLFVSLFVYLFLYPLSGVEDVAARTKHYSYRLP